MLGVTCRPCPQQREDTGETDGSCAAGRSRGPQTPPSEPTGLHSRGLPHIARGHAVDPPGAPLYPLLLQLFVPPNTPEAPP